LQPSIEQTAANLEQLRKTIAAWAPQVLLSTEDLATAERETAEKIRSLEEEFSTFDARRSSLLAERERILQQITNSGQAAPATAQDQPGERSTSLALELASTESELRLATSGMELIALLGRIHTELASALGDLRQVLHGDDPQARASAGKRLKESRVLAQSWLTFAESQRASSSATIAEQEARLTQTAANSPGHAAETRVLAATVRNGELIERLRQLGLHAVRKLDRWSQDGEEALARRPLGRKLADALATVWGAVKSVWAFPVYHYSDAVEVGGQTIKVSRGLSLGRLLGALVFLVLAHWAAAMIIRRIQRGLRERHWGNPAMFPTLRRWTMVAVDGLLVIFTLHLLEIPLTAFAFLGGALAIGFGFGTQTIFKNLISGLIVLGERKIKVGDILEVDGFIGRVTSVDTRSSVLRGFDGVETMVPNSMLLENRVTNWTMSNPRQRRTIRVGVAYGSPVQRAAAILEECADRHGLVLKDPAPLVLFEEFAADSLEFGLYFWVELGETTNANQIASDLRFMIEKRFGEAGIVIAYPQRDVHLTASEPIPVRMATEFQAVQPASSSPAPGA
jgi:small-conductance mechanosensitive channel